MKHNDLLLYRNISAPGKKITKVTQSEHQTIKYLPWLGAIALLLNYLKQSDAHAATNAMTISPMETAVNEQLEQSVLDSFILQFNDSVIVATQVAAEIAAPKTESTTIPEPVVDNYTSAEITDHFITPENQMHEFDPLFYLNTYDAFAEIYGVQTDSETLGVAPDSNMATMYDDGQSNEMMSTTSSAGATEGNGKMLVFLGLIAALGLGLAASGGGGSDTESGLPAPAASPTPAHHTPVAGDIIITEIMFDPGEVDDDAGEWFEIYNDSDHALQLQGLTFKDESGNSFTITNSYLLQAGQHFVLGLSDNTNTNGGVTVNYQYNAEQTGFLLGNNGDVIEIFNANNELIDRVDYSGAVHAETVQFGHSLQLLVSHYHAVENDDAINNWGTTPTNQDLQFGAGDYGTPGELNDLSVDPNLITMNDLIITEMMFNPSTVNDNVGEWFEVYNNSDRVLELQGISFSDASENTFTIQSSHLLQPGQHFVLGLNNNTDTNGDVTIDYNYDAALSLFALNNNGDMIFVYNAQHELIDQVDYSDAVISGTVIAGHSLQLLPNHYHAADNDNIIDNWDTTPTNAELQYGAGDYGTPGEVNIII